MATGMSDQEKLSPWALISRESNADLDNFWPDDTWVVTERLDVPGGWIVRTIVEAPHYGPRQISTVFVLCSECAGERFTPEYLSSHHRQHWRDLMPSEED